MSDQPEAPHDERVDALLKAVLAVHGERLDEAQREHLRGNIERLRDAAAELDLYPLGNGDEPDTSFRAIDRLDRV